MSLGAVDACERRIGRPRSATADQAILDAAIELFIELGYDGLTMEGVAARAGVGKTTVYRRYPGKVDLVMAAAERLSRQKGPTPDTGTLRGDLLALARGFRRMLTTDAGRAIPATLAANARNPELALAHRSFIAQRRADSAAVVTRAIARGELGSEVDVDLLLDLLTAPLFLRAFITGQSLDDAYLGALVDGVIRAFS